MRKLTLSVEYFNLPLFDHSLERMGGVELSELPLSIEMRKKIEEWDQIFQMTFNDEYPPNSGFKNISEMIDFNNRGLELVQKLKLELGPDFKIIYDPLR